MRHLKFSFFLLLTLGMIIVFVGCKEGTKSDKITEPMEKEAKATIVKSSYDTTMEGTPVDLYTLRNKNGMEVDIIT